MEKDKDFYSDDNVDVSFIDEGEFIHLYFSIHGQNFTDIRVKKEKMESVKEILNNSNDELLSEEILLRNGFKKTTTPEEENYYKEIGESFYSSYQLWTNDTPPLKIDIIHGITNGKCEWFVHIDNETCCSIGGCEVDYVWQFNLLMKIVVSKYELPLN